MSDFFHCHVHSEYSVLDGMAKVPALVSRAVRNKQPALALTDHGVMSGSFQLYKGCNAAGILPFPGLEAYIVDDVSDKKAPRFHLTVFALDRKGYQALVRYSSRSHQRDHYHFRPRLDFADLAELSEEASANVAVLTGCYYGRVVQTLVNSGKASARRAVDSLARLFPNLYIEVQHHNRQQDGASDDEIVTELVSIANDAGLLTVATQDAHYELLKHSESHTMMKSLVTHGPPDEAGFPGDGYHLATTKWVRDHYRSDRSLRAAWDMTEQACSALLSKHRLRLPPLDKYEYHVPSVTVDNPDRSLRKSAEQGLRRLGVDTHAYTKRLDEELSVIEQLGMADYFLLIREIMQWARARHIVVNARGSANASLVCYAIGITALDPIRWDLLFERFLSLDRIKPPDIDIDVEDTRRAEIIEFIRTRFDVCNIGTYLTMGIDSEGKGSILVSFLGSRRRQLRDFPRRYGRVRTIDDLEEIEPATAATLSDLASLKVRKAPGVHAAGLALSGEGLAIGDYIPTMLIPSSGATVTQMPMDDVEDLGIIKIDLLGLRSLSTIAMCLELLGRKSDDWHWIPLNDRATFSALRRGRTDTGIFQFEGYAQARGCRELGVKSINDMVVVNALFRPATMANGMKDEYLRRRQGKKFDYLHPILERHTKRTYGIVVYQEQVISILRELGLDVVDLNKLLKAIKSSNDKIGAAASEMDKQREGFFSLCASSGFTSEAADYAWAAVEGFSDYGFNKAHATAYALVGYRMAYLKTHHELEFMSAVLATTAGTAKEPAYVSEARQIGIRLLRADVNISGPTWTMDKRKVAIRKGLTSIKGVGYNAAEAIQQAAPYSSVDDLIARTPARIVTGGKDWAKKGELRGVLAALRSAGALISIGLSRED